MDDAVRAVEQSPFHVIGVLSFPYLDRHWTNEDLFDPTADETYARSFGLRVMSGYWRSCVVYAVTPSHGDYHDAASTLVTLGTRAGTELPLSVRAAIPKQNVDVGAEPTSAIDRWLSLLFWHDPPDAERLFWLNHPVNHWEYVFHDPFSESADVIERCRLTTDSPKFVTKGNLWPRWAGQIPPSLLQVDYKPAADAVTVESPKTKQQATEAAGDGGGKTDAIVRTGEELQKVVASLERQQKKSKKPLTKTENTRNQRIKFCCPRRRKKSPDTWNEIYHDYAAKYPADKTASPDSLLHSHDRNCLKCREQKS